MKHTYFPPFKANSYAVLKARNRGEISATWHETHKLTPETMPEFKALMKQADKEFDKQFNKE